MVASGSIAEVESTKSVSEVYCPVTGTVVEVDHPERGKYLSVGNPIKLSDSPTEVTRSPLLGEHTDAILGDLLGLGNEEIAALRQAGTVA